MIKIAITVRDDGPTKTVIVQDEDGNILGDLEITPVPVGVRVNGYQDQASGSALHVGTFIFRK